MLHVAYVSSARCEVSMWQQQLEYKWNTKPQNCEADAQNTEPADFWQCSCTAWRWFFHLGFKNQIQEQTPYTG